jgi:hypothetical protein
MELLPDNEKAARSLDWVGGYASASALVAPPAQLLLPLTRVKVVNSPDRGQQHITARHGPRGFDGVSLRHGKLLGSVLLDCLVCLGWLPLPFKGKGGIAGWQRN